MFRFGTGLPPWVRFSCKCGKEFPLEELYMCFQCQAILCRPCTSEEIESYYCRTCLENMPTTEAMTFRNRCMRCYQCPICQSTLQIIISAIRGQKQYHLCCLHCSWDSSMVAVSGNTVDEMYKTTAYYIKDDPRQSLFLGIVEKYKKTINVLQKQQRKSLYPIEHRTLERMSLSSIERKTEQVEVLEPKNRPVKQSARLSDLLEESASYDDFTTIEQRHASLPEQTRLVSDMKCMPTPLLTKRSRRCRTCKKYVVKSDGMPTASSPFKMENLAAHFLPRIMIRQWAAGYVLLLLSNPTSTPASFLLDYQSPLENEGLDREIPIDANDPLADSQSEHEDTNPAVVDRERNTMVLRINHRGETEHELRMLWKFVRGSESKEMPLIVRIKYQ